MKKLNIFGLAIATMLLATTACNKGNVPPTTKVTLPNLIVVKTMDNKLDSTSFTYDNSNRITQVKTPQKTISFIYGNDGNLTYRNVSYTNVKQPKEVWKYYYNRRDSVVAIDTNSLYKGSSRLFVINSNKRVFATANGWGGDSWIPGGNCNTPMINATFDANGNYADTYASNGYIEQPISFPLLQYDNAPGMFVQVAGPTASKDLVTLTAYIDDDLPLMYFAYNNLLNFKYRFIGNYTYNTTGFPTKLVVQTTDLSYTPLFKEASFYYIQR